MVSVVVYVSLCFYLYRVNDSEFCASNSFHVHTPFDAILYLALQKNEDKRHGFKKLSCRFQGVRRRTT